MQIVTKTLISFTLAFAIMMYGFVNHHVKASARQTIAESFPDANLAQAIADSVATGDVNDILSQTMIDNTTYLILPNRSISDITGIDIFTNLTDLEIVGNQITSLPDSISNLSHLQILRLANNKLTQLPASIGNISSLTSLDVSYNQLTSLPDNIVSLSNLSNLSLSGNKLTNLPANFGNLINLTRLMLDYNQLTSLPTSFGNLNQLTTLVLENNKLASLPENFGSLSNLAFFNAVDNQLTSLPDSFRNIGKSNPQISGWILLTNNLLPSNYSNLLNTFGFAFIVNSNYQNQLVLNTGISPYSIKSGNDLNAIDLKTIVKLDNNSRLSPAQNFILDNYVDENNIPVNITDYIKNGVVIKAQKLFANVRATGTGLFPNTSDHALTTTAIELDFQTTYYDLTFDLNGGIGSQPALQSLLENELASAPLDNPTKEGYAFMGWNTKADGSGINWDFATTTMSASNVTLFAHWQSNISLDNTLPKTGDTSNAILIGSLLTVSGILMLIARKRVQNN